MNIESPQRVSRWAVAIGLAALTAALAGAGLMAYRAADRRDAALPQLILLVSVASNDTPETMKRFGEAHQADAGRMKLLSGEADAKRILEKACRVRSEHTPSGDPGREYTHNNNVFLVDTNGLVQARYPVAEEVLDSKFEGTGQFRVNGEAVAKLLRDAKRLAATGKLDGPPLGLQIEDFELVDQNGQPVTRETMRGKVCVVGFVFSCCSTSCPFIAEAMAQVQDATQPPSKPITLPTVNAILNSTSATLLVLGFAFIRFRMVRPHVACMLTATCVSALFLCSYLYYHFVETGGQPTPFTGPATVKPVYLGILLSHTILAVVNVPLVAATLILAARDSWARHRRFARWALPIWLYVSVTGVVVYWLLYQAYPMAG